MQFKELVRQLDKLNFPKNKYVVVGSGSLAAHKIREAQDFDILVTWDFWDILASKNKVEMAGHIENINFGNIQVLGHGSAYRNEEIATWDEILATADEFEGHKFINLQFLKKFKTRQAREKDFCDVELIEKYLEAQAAV